MVKTTNARHICAQTRKFEPKCEVKDKNANVWSGISSKEDEEPVEQLSVLSNST